MLRVKGAIDDRPGGTGLPVEVSIDEKLYRDLMAMKTRNTKSWDTVIGVDGLPGVGKSQLSLGTICPILAEKMSNIWVTFDVDEFTDVCVSKAKPFDCVALDEGHAGFNTGQAQRADFQKLINLLMLIRKKNLFLIITTQCYFDLVKTMAIYRMNCLYHVYDDNGKRGGFISFGRKEKKNLYILGKKYLNYRASKYNYVGQFNQNRHLIPEDYEDRKDQHLLNQNSEFDKGPTKKIDQAKRIMDATILNLTILNFKQVQIAKIMNVGHTTVTEHWKRMKEDGKVPEKYLNRYVNRFKSAITPINKDDVILNPQNTAPKCYNIIPEKTHVGAQPPKGGENEATPAEPEELLDSVKQQIKDGKQ